MVEHRTLNPLVTGSSPVQLKLLNTLWYELLILYQFNLTLLEIKYIITFDGHKMTFGLIAQVVEQRPFKAFVVGSSPTELTFVLFVYRSGLQVFHPGKRGSIPLEDVLSRKNNIYPSYFVKSKKGASNKLSYSGINNISALSSRLILLKNSFIKSLLKFVSTNLTPKLFLNTPCQDNDFDIFEIQ